MTARSLRGSGWPTTLASRVRPSLRCTTNRLPPCTTWLFVTIYPSAVRITPRALADLTLHRRTGVAHKVLRGHRAVLVDAHDRRHRLLRGGGKVERRGGRAARPRGVDHRLARGPRVEGERRGGRAVGEIVVGAQGAENAREDGGACKYESRGFHVLVKITNWEGRAFPQFEGPHRPRRNREEWPKGESFPRAAWAFSLCLQTPTDP